MSDFVFIFLIIMQHGGTCYLLTKLPDYATYRDILSNTSKYDNLHDIYPSRSFMLNLDQIVEIGRKGIWLTYALCILNFLIWEVITETYAGDQPVSHSHNTCYIILQWISLMSW